MGRGPVYLAGTCSGATYSLRQLFFYLATTSPPCVRACFRRAGGSFPSLFPARGCVSLCPAAIKRRYHWRRPLPPPEQRAPCQSALFLAVVVAAEMGERQASSRQAIGRCKGGGASNTPLLHPTLAATATRPSGSLSCGQSRAMSCCRWCSDCMHAKSGAWSSSSPYFA
jgi:hypothetical protein